MRKILIIVYYELRDYLQCISDMFVKKYNWTTISYPLYMHAYDRFSRIDNYADHMSEFIREENPDIILWWFTDVPVSLFLRIKSENPNTFFTIYNYNDPINLNKTYIDRCRIFDQVITVCQNSMPFYKMHSQNKYIDFCPIGYDNSVFKEYTPIELSSLDSRYHYDVLLLCDSLYNDQTDQIIERKQLITILDQYCLENDLKFALYGPDFLSQFTKNSYKGEPNYIDMPVMFRFSKINIVSHPSSLKKLCLCNSNLFPILATGGIVLMDCIKGSELFFNEKNRIVYTYKDKQELFTAIKQIISTYNDNPNEIDEQRKRAIQFSKNNSWSALTDRIFLRYNQKNFDHLFYKKIYKKEQTARETLFNEWLKNWREDNIQIGYKIEVPTNFDIENYRQKESLDKELFEDEYVYIHWYNNGKNNDYIKRIANKHTSLSGSTYNVCTTKLFDVFRGFNLIYIYRDIDSGLTILNEISKQNPRLQINECLTKYIDISLNE